jgi:hypothetical protein
MCVTGLLLCFERAASHSRSEWGSERRWSISEVWKMWAIAKERAKGSVVGDYRCISAIMGGQARPAGSVGESLKKMCPSWGRLDGWRTGGETQEMNADGDGRNKWLQLNHKLSPPAVSFKVCLSICQIGCQQGCQWGCQRCKWAEVALETERTRAKMCRVIRIIIQNFIWTFTWELSHPPPPRTHTHIQVSSYLQSSIHVINWFSSSHYYN